uniref:Uncharacterized protein n=1 Tax=Ascaris lumbricoides TaxID=6252 RepID=A0A0M3IXD5_ASCLU
MYQYERIIQMHLSNRFHSYSECVHTCAIATYIMEWTCC